jgi:hypothetical protein
VQTTWIDRTAVAMSWKPYMQVSFLRANFLERSLRW